jgi:hypothetical protein
VPERGPFWSGTLRKPQSNAALVMRGITVSVGSAKNAYIAYDTDLMRVALAWTGEFLDFGDTLTRIEWPPPPQVKGLPAFGNKPSPGWARHGSFADPRADRQGPLPKEWACYQGLCVDGDHVVLKYTVGQAEALESPGFEEINGQPVFIRTLQFVKDGGAQTLLVADGIETTTLRGDFSGNHPAGTLSLARGKSIAIGGVAAPAGARLETEGDRLVLRLDRTPLNQPFQILYSTNSDPAGFAALQKKSAAGSLPDLRDFCRGGPSRWGKTVTTRGVLGRGDEPYLADTLTEPVSNPYNAKTFFGGFDFFSDGRAAICTFHGDVWIVSGIDGSLNRLTWRRFASGLFQPLGLRIVQDTVYVLGRDQITRLLDLNNDGEADAYENFNHDTVVTANYHEFCLDLATDSKGNFYFCKCAPWPPEVTSPSQGCLFKLPPDGSSIEVIATGLRAPNGMTIGPRDEITVSDNQGHWMPSSKLDWIEQGGFYGMVPAAHRDLVLRRDGTNFTANPSDPKDRAKFNFAAWGDTAAPVPASYDRPLCWLPYGVDNSSGAQVWVTGGKWGPLDGQLLFTSYGKCSLFEVMPDLVGGVRQAAMFQFPNTFRSGLMRARMNPVDGQVYLCGLKGWQTSATRDGGFYRVRYTGKPVRMPNAFHASQRGVRIAFTAPVEAKTAADPGNYSAERWNYLYTGAYGSPEVSVDHPGARKHDRLNVADARLLPDGRGVFLEIDDMKTCDQIKIKYKIRAADGTEMPQEIYATINKLLAD